MGIDAVACAAAGHDPAFGLLRQQLHYPGNGGRGERGQGRRAILRRYIARSFSKLKIVAIERFRRRQGKRTAFLSARAIQAAFSNGPCAAARPRQSKVLVQPGGTYGHRSSALPGRVSQAISVVAVDIGDVPNATQIDQLTVIGPSLLQRFVRARGGRPARRGAPCPPASTSAARKSYMTGIGHCSASASCVADLHSVNLGPAHTVWP